MILNRNIKCKHYNIKQERRKGIEDKHEGGILVTVMFHLKISDVLTKIKCKIFKKKYRQKS